MIDTIIAKTKEYLSVPSVVGHERFFMDFLYQDFKKLGLQAYKQDGLLEIRGDSPKDIILCAHLDRHGLISLGDDEYVYAAQYIREVKYGENNESSRKQVEAIAKRFEGEKIYAYHPVSGTKISEGVIEACYPHMLNNDALFYVEGIARLEQNIPLAYARQAVFENDILKGQIDNVISLATVYALYENGYQGTALLTCEEEIGKSWIHIADFLDGMDIETKSLIVLDTSPYADESVIHQGPVILRTRDKSETFNLEILQSLIERCESLDIPYRIKDQDLIAQGKPVEELGSTELGRLVQGGKGRWNGATVQIPTLMYHTSNETTTSKAIENYLRLLEDLVIEKNVEL
jgi:putative aminopeptidase FrvX